MVQLLGLGQKVFKVTKKLIVDYGDDSRLAPFPLSDRHSLTPKVNVAYIELDQLLAPQAQPPERLDETAITEIGGGNNELLHLGGFEVVR